MKLLFKQIVNAVQGFTSDATSDDLLISGVSIDTRTIKPGELYIALPGKNFDGHQFISDAEQLGAAAVIVEHVSPTTLPQIKVANARLALAELAGFWRQQCQLEVVGVTGSNGKTTVKEMIAAILSTQGKTLSTKGNLNNDIGVPLTLLQLDKEHQYAVIEMGANHAGEIAYSSQYVKADVAVITNIGTAHIEGFGSIEGVATSKGEIYASLDDKGVAILNADDAFYPLLSDIAGQRPKTSFGLTHAANVSAKDISAKLTETGFVTEFTLLMGTGNIDIQLHLAGEHNVKNALAAAAVGITLGIDLISIKTGYPK